MTDSPQTGGNGGNPRWVRVALVVSLGANLLIVGMIAGAMIRHSGEGGAARPARPAAEMTLRELGYGPFGRALSRSDQRAIAEALKGRARDLETNRREFRAQMKALVNALRATPYRPEAVRQIIDRQQARLMERQQIGKDLFLEHLEKMTDAERKRYARRLEKVLRRGARR